MVIAGVLSYALLAAAATWFVFRTFYRTNEGTRPFLAVGCATAALAAFVAGGAYLLVMAAIGGAVTL